MLKSCLNKQFKLQLIKKKNKNAEVGPESNNRYAKDSTSRNPSNLGVTLSRHAFSDFKLKKKKRKTIFDINKVETDRRSPKVSIPDFLISQNFRFLQNFNFLEVIARC